MIRNINNKHLVILSGFFVFIILFLATSNFYNILTEDDATQNQITLYKEQNNIMNLKLKQPNGKLNKNIDLNYYINNIYAYSLLEDFSVQIRVGETKFRNTIQLFIDFQEFKDKDKFKSFLTALSLLGIIENINNKSLILHVVDYSINTAKQTINLSEDKKE